MAAATQIGMDFVLALNDLFQKMETRISGLEVEVSRIGNHLHKQDESMEVSAQQVQRTLAQVRELGSYLHGDISTKFPPGYSTTESFPGKSVKEFSELSPTLKLPSGQSATESPPAQSAPLPPPGPSAIAKKPPPVPGMQPPAQKQTSVESSAGKSATECAPGKRASVRFSTESPTEYGPLQDFTASPKQKDAIQSCVALSSTGCPPVKRPPMKAGTECAPVPGMRCAPMKPLSETPTSWKAPPPHLDDDIFFVD